METITFMLTAVGEILLLVVAMILAGVCIWVLFMLIGFGMGLANLAFHGAIWLIMKGKEWVS